MCASMAQRLAFDPDHDLAKLVRAFADEQIMLVDTGLAEHFAIAREKRAAFVNHPPVLAMSIGGTNTKIMLAEMRAGKVVASRVKALPNPAEDTPWQDYFDLLLMEDPLLREYLASHPSARIGLSLAVPIADGVPWHPTKIPTITGLTARSLDGDVSGFHLGENLKRYFAQRNLPDIPVKYQGDAVIAHLGGVAVSDLADDEQTMLMVCGSGLACADEGHFVLVATHRCVEGDGEIYDLDQMEGGQYQYLIAGKGLFGLMARTIAADARQEGSPLAGLDLGEFFRSGPDSRTVVELWESSLEGHEPAGQARLIRDRVSGEAFERLQWLAGRLVDRGISVLANCILSTGSWMGPSGDGRGPRLFLEGSIALHPPILNRVLVDVQQRCESSEVFDQLGAHRPQIPRPQLDVLDVQPADGVAAEEVAKADLTTVGALAMGIAEDLMGR